MKEKLIAMLQENLPDIDFASSDKLVDDGILDSVTLVELISLFLDEFDIAVPYKDIVAANFNSLDTMAAMLERLQ